MVAGIPRLHPDETSPCSVGEIRATSVPGMLRQSTVPSSNGFIKRASPVVKVFSDGQYETNEESEGCVVARLSAGEYLIRVGVQV